MTIEIEVKFNIGDKVIVKKSTGNGLYYAKNFPIEATISGFVITKDRRRTTVYYFIDEVKGEYGLAKATSHRRRYPAKYLEKIEN